ncbi:MAG TPA: Crp/Fnr family transcriptional regulator [Gammaproteobacteria bacterium]|nr:Crp/Fnr family transcriptional regulator [Gammaproteobacteria bacterium]
MTTPIRWEPLFPQLAAPADAALAQLMATARPLVAPADAVVFSPGTPCQSYLLVLQGSVRVSLSAENGREIVLYRVRAGESCILTTSCLLGATRYPAVGITETETTALSLPLAAFNRALEGSAAFRRFVFARLGERLAAVIARMEEVAFRSIDSRLAAALLAFSEATPELRLTHQSLATELGTAREVISRHLKRFEEQGWVRLGRGTITVLDRAALARAGEGETR